MNHEGSFEQAKRLIELAKEGGAHAAKFQSYKAGTLAAKNSPSYWDLSKEKTTSQFELFKKYDAFGAKEYEALKKHCDQVGIDFLSTPFDDEAVDYLDGLVPFFKIASADLTNHPFLRKVARKGKPVVLSTGASRIGEVDLAVQVLKDAGCESISLLHCMLNYPTSPENAHLSMIDDLMQLYPSLVIGYSDHVPPDSSMWALTVAYLKGARVIEKHFTHDKSLPGNDHYHAMTAEDAKVFWQKVRETKALLGHDHKGPIASEAISRKNARRSLVTKGPIKEGEKFTENNLTYKRPGTGVSPSHWEEVIGATATADMEDDHILQWSDVKCLQGGRKVVGIVQARMGSARFPGKMLRLLGGRPLIQWVIERSLRAIQLDELVLATTTNRIDDELVSAAVRMGVTVIRGSEHDVLSRFVMAAKRSNASAVVRICADNPLIDPDEIDRLVNYYLQNRPDYAFNHLSRLGSKYADGFGAEIMSAEVLYEMDRAARQQDQREHLTKYIWDNQHAFQIGVIQAPNFLAHEGLKFDVDTPEDLAALERVIAGHDLRAPAKSFIDAALSH